MAPKNSKASVGSTITDYFSRSSRVSSSLPSSSQTLSQPPLKQRLPPRPDQEVISVSSTSHITVSSGTRSIITVASSSRTRPSGSYDPMESVSSRGATRAAHYHVAPAAKSSSAKQPAKHSTASKSSFKRKAKLDSDSEIEQIEAVAYIPRSPARARASAPVPPKPTPFSEKENLTHQLPQANPSRKKPRISSPEPRLPSPEPPVALSDPGELVPSSQSDEQDELILRRPAARDPMAVMQEVDRWRNEARSPVSLPMSEPEDVEMSPPEVTHEDVVVVEEAPRAVFTPEPSPEPQQQPMLLTPQQPRLLPSLPVTPVALTEASKTAKIIADIKARAYADALSSPENSPLGELKELEESSDEEEDPFSGFTRKDGPFSSPLSPVPTARYTLRDRGASSAASTSRKSPSPSSSRPFRAPPPRPAPKKVAPADPLGALLNEKRRADKGGKGGVAFQLAEAAMRAESPLSEESDEGKPEDWTDEAAALAAVKRHGHAWDTSSPGPSSSDGDEVSLNDEDRCRLLGDKRGKAVVGILASDRAKREAAKGKQKVLGVPLWEVDATPMDTDLAIPSLPGYLCGQPVLALFKSIVESGDLAQAALLLDSGIFATSNLLEHEDTVLYFCDLALSPRDTLLTTPAFRTLSQIWNSPSVRAPGMPFRAMHSTLMRLGAKQAVMDANEWVTAPGVHREPIQSSERDGVLFRLVRLLTISTLSAQQKPSEVPNFVMALLLVGMDPSSSAELQREIMIAVDVLCQSVAPTTDISTEIETTICNKLVKFASDLQPINKAQLVTLLAGGTGRSARIARWVAHAVLTRSMPISVEKYSDLPPLTSLLEFALAPEIAEVDPEARIRGVFDLHNDTDYTDLGFYVRVLAVAISNVQGYVLEEARAPAAPPTPGSPGKPSTEKPDTLLMTVRNAIENLHSRIVDTRAAHLDRSRAKGALKQLSMRIYYQQEAASRNRRGNKSRPIQQYFAKPK
ncbi:hypothetical protein B0H17DRAFT_1127442 [Mycena rosella]|uniref:Uncharacterized protein n=1 Tax=Mycena rosella TaxID=1033263 RepID=A0AAD7E096_MYCRO|nr:hypothetical protein B0H17DRAFT_1127442 [Mycena rosella]